MTKKPNTEQSQRSTVSAEGLSAYSKQQLDMFFVLVEMASKMHESGASEEDILTAIKTEAEAYKAAHQSKG